MPFCVETSVEVNNGLLSGWQIERVRKESEECERLLKERLQRADAQRLELEDELSRCKINIASERLVTDEQLSAATQRIRTEEVSLLQYLYCVAVGMLLKKISF